MKQVEKLLLDKDIYYLSSGKDYKIKCLNPEHVDVNPSMRVDQLTGIFNCFSCGYKGNIFSFFNEETDYFEIRKELFKRKLLEKRAENVGLNMPRNAVPFKRDWRGISGETFKHFEAFEHNDTQYLGRIVFPIRNISGKIVGFNARALSQELQPKYLISPTNSKFPLFPAKVSPISGRIILVEGIFDMLNLWDKGLTNVVCCFGTHKVTKDKITLLKIQGIKGIDIIFDSDEAGVEAAEKAKKIIEEVEINTRIISLKSGDPGELTAYKVIKLKEKLYG